MSSACMPPGSGEFTSMGVATIVLACAEKRYRSVANHIENSAVGRSCQVGTYLFLVFFGRSFVEAVVFCMAACFASKIDTGFG